MFKGKDPSSITSS